MTLLEHLEEQHIILADCPFCGSSSLKMMKRKITYRGKRAYVASVRCNRCHARGGTVLNLSLPYAVKEDVENEAIFKWNMRTEKPLEKGTAVKGGDESD